MASRRHGGGGHEDGPPQWNHSPRPLPPPPLHPRRGLSPPVPHSHPHARDDAFVHRQERELFPHRLRGVRDAYHHPSPPRSRYGGRYDGDRRSRSPRDRSPPPYGDKYGDGDRRRQSVDTRSNPGYPGPRDGAFRDTPTGRDPPRAPKALLDSPSGPRGGGFPSDFRGRGRGAGGGGGGRGRGWGRDDSRDRERGRELDFRDRPHFRDDRSREREREWRERERDGGFRARRPSPPGRGRSPISRDFRDTRDPPLGVDAERARRGSRDGPLSAGSSSSDPQFGSAAAFGRGTFARGGPRGGRGRGDYDRGAGRGRGGFYDDPRDRYPGPGLPRSRSQEGRWAREQEDRDRRDGRYADPPRDIRDDRDLRDRDRDLIRPKPDRVSHEPPTSAKDVSPPPLAPSAPAFGSVPSRQPSSADIQSLTGKPPPTGPRALAEERPVSAGHAVGTDRPPPTGPSKPVLPDGGPPIPVGPRAQQQKQQQRSSKQWINPALSGKKIPDSPKVARSQSFASQQQQRPFGHRPESSHSEQHGGLERRPRSSDAQSDSHIPTTDGHSRGLHPRDPNDIKLERGTQSARASVDRDSRAAFDVDVKMGGMDVAEPPAKDRVSDFHGGQSTSSTAPAPSMATQEKDRRNASEAKTGGEQRKARTFLAIPSARVQLPEKQPLQPLVDEASDDDEDDDMDSYFAEKMGQTERELKKFEHSGDSAPPRITTRYAKVLHASLEKLLNDQLKLASLIGDLPEGSTFVSLKDRPQQQQQAPEQPPAPAVETREEIPAASAPAPTPVPVSVPAPAPVPPPAREPSAIPTVETNDALPSQSDDLQPKVEEMDTEGSGLPPLPTVEQTQDRTEDVEMTDAADAGDTAATAGPPAPPINGIPPAADGLGIFPIHQPASRSPSPMDEDSEDRTEDDVSMDGSVGMVRQYSPTPPTEDLPRYNLKPWYESPKVRKLCSGSPDFDAFLMSRMRGKMASIDEERVDAKTEYRASYDAYLRFTLSDDPAAIKSRTHFATSGTTTTTTTGKEKQPAEAKPEGRRGANRFGTELDLDWAIEQSAREHKEKEDREARAQKEKYRSEKEAVIPDMIWTAEDGKQERYYDKSGLVSLEKLIAVWQVAPCHINFTEEEIEKFEKAYLDAPKQWGKISGELPNRDFRTCIQYYYAMKRDLNLKEKLRKRPKKSRKAKQAKQRSSALVSELGNTEHENEEQPQENGENGERRRPRRAAAPTWGFETAPNADADGATPSATPVRRRGQAAAAAAAAAAAVSGALPGLETKGDSGAEKTEVKKPRKQRQPKADKEPKAPKPAQTLVPTPPAMANKVNRSRSNSRAQGPEWTTPETLDSASRHLGHFAMASGAMQPPTVPSQPQSLASPERGPVPVASALSDVMAPPSLRPDPPPPLATVPTFDISQPSSSERTRAAQQASSYWSVSETNDFPHYLRSFGTDWSSIAGHMQSKTAVMVSTCMRYDDRATCMLTLLVRSKTTMFAKRRRAKRNGKPSPQRPTRSARGERSVRLRRCPRPVPGSDTMFRRAVLDRSPPPSRMSPLPRRSQHRQASRSRASRCWRPKLHRCRTRCRFPRPLPPLRCPSRRQHHCLSNHCLPVHPRPKACLPARTACAPLPLQANSLPFLTWTRTERWAMPHPPLSRRRPPCLRCGSLRSQCQVLRSRTRPCRRARCARQVGRQIWIKAPRVSRSRPRRAGTLGTFGSVKPGRTCRQESLCGPPPEAPSDPSPRWSSSLCSKRPTNHSLHLSAWSSLGASRSPRKGRPSTHVPSHPHHSRFPCLGRSPSETCWPMCLPSCTFRGRQLPRGRSLPSRGQCKHPARTLTWPPQYTFNQRPQVSRHLWQPVTPSAKPAVSWRCSTTTRPLHQRESTR